MVFESLGPKIINQGPMGDVSPGSESRTGTLGSDLKTKIIEDHKISGPHAIHVGA